jgi:hypothetical protein
MLAYKGYHKANISSTSLRHLLFNEGYTSTATASTQCPPNRQDWIGTTDQSRLLHEGSRTLIKDNDCATLCPHDPIHASVRLPLTLTEPDGNDTLHCVMWSPVEYAPAWTEQQAPRCQPVLVQRNNTNALTWSAFSATCSAATEVGLIHLARGVSIAPAIRKVLSPCAHTRCDGALVEDAHRDMNLPAPHRPQYGKPVHAAYPVVLAVAHPHLHRKAFQIQQHKAHAGALPSHILLSCPPLFLRRQCKA